MFTFLRDRHALETSEFAVLAAAIIVVVYGAFKLLGANVANIINPVASFI